VPQIYADILESDAMIPNTLSINKRGALSIGRSVVIDGHSNCLARIVTHAHSDHISDLNASISRCRSIMATPLTIDWLTELGYSLPTYKVRKLDYGERVEVENLELLFMKTLHIPGSLQVAVNDYESGLRIVYTSDFKKPGRETPIIESDILVVDAVYGSPSYVREFDDYIDQILADFVKQLLTSGPVFIYGYHGKLQEVMQILRSEGVLAPYILPSKVYRLTKIAEGYGLRVNDYLLAESDEGREVIQSNWFIYFEHVNSSKAVRSNKATHLILSGWEFKKPYRRLGRRYWLVAFSDHADFNGLLTYVINSNPKVVVVNSARSTHADVFAKEVEKRTGINSIVMP